MPKAIAGLTSLDSELALVLLERVFSRCEEGPETYKGTLCWNWSLSTCISGYGHYRHANQTWRAHRLTYILTKGYITDGLVIDHLCHNRRCCNPEHLEMITSTENTRRGNLHKPPGAYNKAKTHCKWGHEFTPENTYVNTKSRQRTCKTCKREKQINRRHFTAKTHCVNGHEYTEENTYRYPNGKFYCITCQRKNKAAFEERKRCSNRGC